MWTKCGSVQKVSEYHDYKNVFFTFYIELTGRIYVPSFITDILSAVQIMAFFPFSNLVFLSFLKPFVLLARFLR